MMMMERWRLSLSECRHTSGQTSLRQTRPLHCHPAHQGILENKAASEWPQVTSDSRHCPINNHHWVWGGADKSAHWPEHLMLTPPPCGCPTSIGLPRDDRKSRKWDGTLQLDSTFLRIYREEDRWDKDRRRWGGGNISLNCDITLRTKPDWLV